MDLRLPALSLARAGMGERAQTESAKLLRITKEMVHELHDYLSRGNRPRLLRWDMDLSVVQCG
jgi:hypothetical protein